MKDQYSRPRGFIALAALAIVACLIAMFVPFAGDAHAGGCAVAIQSNVVQSFAVPVVQQFHQQAAVIQSGCHIPIQQQAVAFQQFAVPVQTFAVQHVQALATPAVVVLNQNVHARQRAQVVRTRTVTRISRR